MTCPSQQHEITDTTLTVAGQKPNILNCKKTPVELEVRVQTNWKPVTGQSTVSRAVLLPSSGEHRYASVVSQCAALSTPTAVLTALPFHTVDTPSACAAGSEVHSIG